MSAEFVDTNILIYAHDGGAGSKHTKSIELLETLFDRGIGALSVQVLFEFYSVATKKLLMKSEDAAAVIRDLEGWNIHRPGVQDLLRASEIHRRHKLSWWDALVIQSAAEMHCAVLWSEDLQANRTYVGVTVRNPFA